VLFGTPPAQLKALRSPAEVRVLHEFIAVNRDEIISRCRAKVSARSTPPPTEAEIDHGVPVFLDQLTTPLLLKLVQTGKLRPAGLVTHRFGLDDIMQAYDTFADAATTSALKVVLNGRGPN
jgi:hypothetical protein